jgi:Putative auto-transporter adhesin, head GIN domain
MHSGMAKFFLMKKRYRSPCKQKNSALVLLYDINYSPATMNRNLLSLLSIGIILSAAAATLMACNVASVEGNGDVKRESRSLSGYTEIELSLPGEVEVRQGASFSFAVEAESNLLELIETKVSGGTLMIKSSKNMVNTKNIRYYITMPSLEEVEIKGSGSMTVPDIFSPKNLEIEVTGSGKFVGNFIAGKVEVDVTGSGKVTLGGSAEELEVDVTGSGMMDAQEMQAKEVSVEVAGSGSVLCHPVEVLKADIAGSGVVKYKGNPHRITQDVAGSGKIEKL